MSVSMFQLERTTINGAPTQGAHEAPARPGTSRFLSFTTTVPKEFVHRAAVAEVLLTDWCRENDTRFVMAGQWPRGHSFFTPVGEGYHDPLIAAETIRQAGILLAHAEFGIPWATTSSSRTSTSRYGSRTSGSVTPRRPWTSPSRARTSSAAATASRECAWRWRYAVRDTSPRRAADP